MKFRLAKAISLYEAYLQETSEVAEPSSASVSSRDSMIKDVDTIINSLETLATQIAEDLENEPNLTEAGEESATKKVADFLIFARKYKKMQQKINAMKISKADLEFAAKNLPSSESDKKETLRTKAEVLGTQIDDLQTLVNDKAQERGQYVQKVLSKTKIEGQMELVKKTLGMDPSATAKKDLADRMADLKQRYQEETAAMKELEDKQETPQQTPREEEPTGDEKSKTAADTSELEADIEAFDKNIRDEKVNLKKLEQALKDLNAEKSKSTNPQSFDEKIVDAETEVEKAKEDLKELQADRANTIKKLKALKSNESIQIDENINKNALLNRAEAVGLTNLAEEINGKQEWQLNKTALYSKFDAEIRKAEYNSTLEASKYHNLLSVKDRFSKLI